MRSWTRGLFAGVGGQDELLHSAWGDELDVRNDPGLLGVGPVRRRVEAQAARMRRRRVAGWRLVVTPAVWFW